MRCSMVIATGVLISLGSSPAISQALDRSFRPPVSTSVPGAPVSNEAGGITPPLRPSFPDRQAAAAPLQVAPATTQSVLPAPQAAALPEDQPPAPASSAVPDGQIAFVRSFIVALNHANMTGNYSVLRDLTVQEFRDANTVESLAEIYRPFREQNIDLSAALVIMPQIPGGATSLPDGSVRLRGSFPTSPLVIMFDISARRIENRWQATELVIAAVPPNN
jgi:hypothetical protein